MRIRTLLMLSCATGLLQACSSANFGNSGPETAPLYGNYQNVDDHSLCLGMMAFAADFPHLVWPNKDKAFYVNQKADLGIRSAALYKISVTKYGKQDAAERGITGYSSAKTLGYVLGPQAVQEALGRCKSVTDQALAVDGDYQKFLDHLGQKAEDPVLPEVTQPATSTTISDDSTNEPITPSVKRRKRKS